MMNHKVHAFIYLYIKMNCKLTVERACWTITQMIKSGSTSTDILQLLFHDERLSHEIAQTALRVSIEHSNEHYLKATLKHLYFQKQINEDQLLQF